MRCFDSTVSGALEKQIQIIKFIKITFYFSFICRKQKDLRQGEERKLSWYILITSNLITDLTVTSSDYWIPIFTNGCCLGKTDENILKQEGESLVPVPFPWPLFLHCYLIGLVLIHSPLLPARNAKEVGGCNPYCFQCSPSCTWRECQG